MSSTIESLQDVLQDVFGDDNIRITAESTAEDVEGWDSLMHINVVIAVEKRFGIRFAAAEVAGMKQAGQNLGHFRDLIERKVAAKR